MARSRKVARKNAPVSSYNSNYGLVNDMAMIPFTIAPTETPTADLESQTNPLNDNRLIQDNYMNFQIPQKIDYLDKDFLLSNIIDNNELCFLSFKDLCKCYFPHKSLMQLGNLTCGSADDESIKYASFFVCIGTKKGHNSVLKVPFNSKRIIDSKKNLYIDKSPDYQNLFVPFLNEMFNKENLDILNETYDRDDILTVSLFYRESYKNSKTKTLIFTDHLIGVASIVQDDQPSCLLVWLGIASKFPCKKPSVGAMKDKLDNMRGALNIGTFFICTIQWIKSILVGQWTPVTCQVFQGAKSGPLYFYKKSYFMKLERDHNLIHLQYLRRREHIIDDDKTLRWYALFYPLQYLTMFEINTLTDEQESVGIILNRANYFFLTQRTHSYPVDEVVPYFEQYFGTSLDENTSLQITKTLPDIQLDNSVANLWVRLVTDEKQEIHQVFATSEILNSMFEVNENIKLKTMNFYEAENEVTPAGYIFLLASKVFFGSATYHYIIRQFFYFIFKSLSKLRKGHPFFEEVMPALVNLIIKRTYFNSGYGLTELKQIYSLPDTIQEMHDNKTGKVLKMYYSGLLNLYAESFLRSKFQGDECDIYFLKEIFNSSLSIINVTSTDTVPIEANYMRRYDIEIHQSNAVPFLSIEFIIPFIHYVKGIVPSISTNRILKHIWLTRVDINELYIMTVTDEYEEKILQLPDSVGGCESFTIIEDTLAVIEDDGEAIEFRFEKILDLIIDRVQKESSAYDMGKIYEQYIKVRKWKTYTRLFKSTKGGKLKDNDPDELAIGPLFDLADFSNARINNDLLMPIVRILDPWQEVFYSQTQAIRNKMSFAEIITFRKETWISDGASECFLDMLNDPKMGLSSKTWVLNYSKFEWIIQSQQSIRRFINNLPFNCSKILIFVHSEDHYILVEVVIPSNEDKEVSVYIADSAKDDEFLDVLTEEVRNANVDLLAAAFNPHLPIRYHQVRDVVKKKNNYDCGVCCCQRAYFYKRFDNPITIPQEGEYLKDTVTFRVFMLAEILNFYRKRISPSVYFESPIHRPVDWNINNVQDHSLEEMNVAGDLLNFLSSPDTNLPTEANTTSIVYNENEKMKSEKGNALSNVSSENERINADEVRVLEEFNAVLLNDQNSDVNEDISIEGSGNKQTSPNLNQDETDQDPNLDANKNISNEGSGNKQTLVNLNRDKIDQNPNSDENEDISNESSENKQTSPKATSRKSIGGKGLFILEGAGSGSGDDDSSEDTATIVYDDEEDND